MLSKTLVKKKYFRKFLFFLLSNAKICEQEYVLSLHTKKFAKENTYRLDVWRHNFDVIADVLSNAYVKPR